MPTDYLVVDPDGNELAVVPDPEWGLAVLLVEPVIDALKEISGGRIVGPLDRGRVLAVSGFGLSTEVVELLGQIPKRPRDLHQAVVKLGYQWETYSV